MKNFFNSKTMRERVLMAAFILIGALWWGTSLLGRTQLLKQEWKITSADIDEQQNWLKNKTQVEQRTLKVTAQLNPAKTFNATQAFTEVNRLTQGMEVTIGETRTERSENFAMHSLQVTIRKVGMPSLIKFYLELSQKAPYLGIDKCSISMDRANPGQVNAAIRIYSVEMLTPVAAK